MSRHCSSRAEAITLRVEVIATRLEAIAIRLEAIATRNKEKRKGRKVTSSKNAPSSTARSHVRSAPSPFVAMPGAPFVASLFAIGVEAIHVLLDPCSSAH